MGRRRAPFPPGTAARMAVLLNQVSAKAPYQRLQCVWLATQGQSAEQIARTLGWHPESVRSVLHRFETKGEAALLGAPRGGRWHQNLTAAEETRLPEPFLAAAERGEALVAMEVKAAYEDALGRPVPRSTIYRILVRHGWRKFKHRPLPPRRAPVVRTALEGGARTTAAPPSRGTRRAAARRQPASVGR